MHINQPQTIGKCRSAVLCLTLASMPGTAFAATVAADSTQPLNTVVQKLREATVRVLANEDRSSGVIISSAGHILTVAHGLPALPVNIRVVLSTGETLDAKLLYRDTLSDVALIQVQQDRGNNVASFRPLVCAKSLKLYARPGSVVLASGCPARESDNFGPVCRIGSVIACSEKRIRSGCQLTAGDSGGPLINQDGVLIGINQKIGAGFASNLHLTIDACRAAVGAHWPDTSIVVHTDAASEYTGEEVSLSPPVTVQESLTTHSCEIVSKTTGQNISMATRILPTVVAAKLSDQIYGDNIQVRYHNRQFEVERHLQHPAEDLAIFWVPDMKGLPAHPELQQTELLPGTLVFSQGEAVGIVSRTRHDEPLLTGTLGCSLTESPGKISVDEVSPNSAAAGAGLEPHDEIATLNGASVVSLEEVAKALTPLQPGDRVTLGVHRNGKNLRLSAQLNHPTNTLLDRSEYLDGRSGVLSKRRTGFQNVIQHDAVLASDHMGGPLLNSQGSLVGVNIARRSRESVLALPIQRVIKIAESAFDER